MKSSLCLKASSFSYPSDICIPDDIAPMPSQTGWRSQASSRACVLNNGVITGNVHIATLEEYNLTTGVATGNTKPNAVADANYIPDYQDTNLCTPPQQSGGETATVSVQQADAEQFNFTVTLTQPLSVPVTFNFAAQTMQGGISRVMPTVPSVTVPAGQLIATAQGGYYFIANGAITAITAQIVNTSPVMPDGKAITFQNQ